MKKTYSSGLLLFAGLCLLAQPFLSVHSAAAMSFFSFPYHWIAKGLRALSLSGSAGNLVALALYTLIALIPLFALLALKKKRPLESEDALLVLLSFLIFGVLYVMINPHSIPYFSGLPGASEMLGGVLHSVVLAFLALRLLRLFSGADEGKLTHYLGLLLYLIAAVCIFLVFGLLLRSFLNSVIAVRAANTAIGEEVSLTYFFLFLQYLVSALPNLLTILIAHRAALLLETYVSERYSENTLTSAQSLSALCIRALQISILTLMGFQVLQFLLMSQLHVTNFVVHIPVFEMAFVLAVLLFTRMIASAHKLQDENDSFV